MTTEQTDQTILTLMPGGKTLAKEFEQLSFEEKLLRLRTVPAGTRINLITEDPEEKKLIQALPPQEYYLTIKEAGEGDSLPLIQYATAAQCAFILDMELWDKWSFNLDNAFKWMERLLACSAEEAVTLLENLDSELLLLFLLEEIDVGADTGDMSTDAERLGNWDHTFDNLYFITFRNNNHARLIGALLDILFRLDHSLYLDLMEGCRGALKSEIEELCHQFRNGRLADLGFPDYEQSIRIYVPITPDTFTYSTPKSNLKPAEDEVTFLPRMLDEASLLGQGLARADSDSLNQELGGVINAALIAEHGNLFSEDSIQLVFRRVHGRLNIAIEHLADGSPARAAEILSAEPLKRLFQLGCGIVQEIAAEARKLNSPDYATGKALRGFSAERPRFYRGLDPDHVDGYREFNSLDDVRHARKFLEMIQG